LQPIWIYEVGKLEDQLLLGQDDSFVALQHAWAKVCEVLAERVQKLSFDSWIKPVVPVSFDGDIVVLSTNSRFAKYWIEERYLADIKSLLEQNLGQKVKVEIRNCKAEEANPVLDEPLPVKKPRKDSSEESLFLPLNNRYSFDSFVVGPCNRLAHATAVSVSEKPGRLYNPLFIYGRPGMGKTHILHAIGLAALQANPNLRVAYVRGETFTYHYIMALREQRISEFRKRYRTIDLWLVDDVQFLVGKDRTEEEFLHTYNDLYDSGKQIVMASDRSPRDLGLSPRLMSRLECGMVADIATPDLETRIAILQSKAEKENIGLSHDVLAYVAGLISSSVRQLEGALIKLHAYGALMHKEISPELAREVLNNYYGVEQATKDVDLRMVQTAVARKFNVSVDDLTGQKRNKEIVMPRQVAMYLARQLTDASLPCIGRAFGGRDHSTVLHSIEKVKQMMVSDPSVAQIVEQIISDITSGS